MTFMQQDGERAGCPAVPLHRCGAAVFLLVTTLLVSGCFFDSGPGDKPPPLSDGDWTPSLPVAPAGWPSIHWPADNSFTPAKAILGRRLFFEPALSRTNDRACSWCHGAGAAFADEHGKPFSTGVLDQKTLRNTPTLANMAFGAIFMLDGKASTLEEQALLPLFASNEMDMTGPEVEDRLAGDTAYVRLFRQAYGDGAVTLERVAKALATYQRTLISYQAPFDRWQAGDEDAISPAAKRGAALFTGAKAGCASCHALPLFTDGSFHNIGLDSATIDRGRALVTGRVEDEGAFKTPTLRNSEITYPYMHDARFMTIWEVLDHYNAGGRPHPNRDPRIRPLGLTAGEIQDLVAFLETLTDPHFLASPEYRVWYPE